jgi:hypothetical protein
VKQTQLPSFRLSFYTYLKWALRRINQQELAATTINRNHNMMMMLMSMIKGIKGARLGSYCFFARFPFFIKILLYASHANAGKALI